MVTYETGLAAVRSRQYDWGTEAVELADAAGRVLATDVVADRDQPPFDRVAMDGIAIDYAAYAAGRRRFAVSHLAPAGAPPRPVASPDHCVEVMTGAPLPPGTTTVIRYEDVNKRDGDFGVPEGVEDNASIHPRGRDGLSGTVILGEGVRIGPAAIGALATFGYHRPRVKRLPRVAVASTGDEIVAVHQRPEAHQIRSSNVHQLSALFRFAGIGVTKAHIPDDPQRGPALIGELLAAHDVLVLSGGVSKGKWDHVPEWLAAAGVNRLFHRVAQRPGKPLWVGHTERTMVFALPGNPASSLVGTIAYVAPWLRDNLGLPDRREKRTLVEPVTFRPRLTRFLPVRRADPGAVRPVDSSGSGDLVSLLRTDGFLVLPAGEEDFPAGGRYTYLPMTLL